MDDERLNRQLLEAMLTPEGYVLQTAANGELTKPVDRAELCARVRTLLRPEA